MSWTSSVGPSNFDTTSTFATAKYVQDNLEDQISGRNNLSKMLIASDNNAAFREKVGWAPRKRPYVTGQQIEVPLKYALGDSQWINGSSPLNTSRHEYATIAAYQWKELVSPPIVINRRQKTLNSGPTQLMQLRQMDIDQAMDTMIDDLETAIGGTVSGFSVLGLQDLVEDSPSSTIGGIARGSYSWFNNQTYTTSVTAFGTSHAGYIGMETLWADCEFGSQSPDLIATTQDVQRFLKQYLVANGNWNTFENDERASDIGRGVPYFHGAPVIQSAGIAANHMYMLNTNTVFLVLYPDQEFVATGEVMAYGSLQSVEYIYLMLAAIITNPRMNGVATSITGY